MPNYPDVSRDNPYLMSRSDGSIIDAKSYGMEVGSLYSLGCLYIGHGILYSGCVCCLYGDPGLEGTNSVNIGMQFWEW